MKFGTWFPWRHLVRRLARHHGFIDPLAIYARLQQFGEPSEIAEPIELLRAGVVFHARGLVNSRAVQHNLDWVWPYWIERQFNPADVSFMPRAFSLTHVNLTHRNWTAIGLPGRDVLPIVDPRGLVTPFWDGWSIDVWLIDDSGRQLLPSRQVEAMQRQIESDSVHAVETRTTADGLSLLTDARLLASDAGDVCRISATGDCEQDGWLIFSLRPANPEGVSFVDHVALGDERRSWRINHHDRVRFDQRVERHHASRYKDADVYVHLAERADNEMARCSVGLATAAAMFKVSAGSSRRVTLDVDVDAHATTRLRGILRYPEGWGEVGTAGQTSSGSPSMSWGDALEESAALSVPDERHMRLWHAAVRTLVLCSPGEVWAGPATYKRFWYRDAAFIALGLLGAGLASRAEAIIKRFPDGQRHNGYYHSQDGEWDSNGEVLWITERVYRTLDREPGDRLWRSLASGADWIVQKRLPDSGDEPHAGLLPAGFSAEHLGPNDHYYWDAAWAWAGLEAAVAMAERRGASARRTERWRDAAEALQKAILRSFEHVAERRGITGIPAAPARRLDAGAIGSVAFAYPLQLLEPRDPRLLGTLQYLLESSFHDGGFFQNMIHSGVNAYLTLHVAEALLRAGDPRHGRLTDRVAELASATGHWPEAVHPHTGGGCMGDGHHAWAAAEWLMITRNAFVREEGETLEIGAGVRPRWLAAGTPLRFGPAPTRFGKISICIDVNTGADGWRVQCTGDWHHSAPRLCIRLAGCEPAILEAVEAGQAARERSAIVAPRTMEDTACTS